MKIAILAQRNSIHAVRWVNGLALRGHSVHLLSSMDAGEPLHEDVVFHKLPVNPPHGYFLNVFAVRKILKRVEPDILNSHFASGYGTLGRLSGFSPHVLSVWGSDVFEFPEKSVLHEKLIRRNLLRASLVCSTSRAMAARTKELAPLIDVAVTPFGVDIDEFRPKDCEREVNDEPLIVGTVKTLAPKYGIDLLLRAFALLVDMGNCSSALDTARLMIVGGGPDEAELKDLARRLGISGRTDFTGPVPHADVPRYLQELDVYVALSRIESFGVAIIEASSCAIPVIVSNVGGLPEVVEDGVTGIIVEPENPSAAATALRSLLADPVLRRQMGDAGRQEVLRKYTWKHSIDVMEAAYMSVLKSPN